MAYDPAISVWVAEKQSLLEQFERGHINTSDTNFAEFKNEGREVLWHIGRQFIKASVSQIVEHGSQFTKQAEDVENFDVLTRTGLGRGIRPMVFCSGKSLPIRASLSHSDSLFALAVSSDPNTYVGIDIVNLTELEQTALDFWFTKRELAALDRCTAMAQRNKQMSLIWSLKEALYKAANFGEAFRPHRWEVVFNQPDGAAEAFIQCFHNCQSIELSVFETRLVGQHRVTAVAIDNPGSRLARKPANTHRITWQTVS